MARKRKRSTKRRSTTGAAGLRRQVTSLKKKLSRVKKAVR